MRECFRCCTGTGTRDTRVGSRGLQLLTHSLHAFNARCCRVQSATQQECHRESDGAGAQLPAYHNTGGNMPVGSTGTARSPPPWSQTAQCSRRVQPDSPSSAKGEALNLLLWAAVVLLRRVTTTALVNSANKYTLNNNALCIMLQAVVYAVVLLQSSQGTTQSSQGSDVNFDALQLHSASGTTPVVAVTPHSS